MQRAWPVRRRDAARLSRSAQPQQPGAAGAAAARRSRLAARQRPGTADAALARLGRRCISLARPARQRPGAAVTLGGRRGSEASRSAGALRAVAPGRRRLAIQPWWSYKMHAAAAPAEDRRRSAADIWEAVRARIQRTGVYALLERHNLLSRGTRL